MTAFLWFLIVAVWWLTGLVGLAYSFAGLRTALGMRRVDGESKRLTDLVLYLAVARTTIFAGPLLGAPILFNMFRLRGSTNLSDAVPLSLPFGVVLLGAVVMVVATVVTLGLTIMDVRSVTGSDDDG